MTSFEQFEFKGALAAQHRELINPLKPDNFSSKIPQVALKFAVQRYFIVSAAFPDNYQILTSYNRSMNY